MFTHIHIYRVLINSVIHSKQHIYTRIPVSLNILEQKCKRQLASHCFKLLLKDQKTLQKCKK